MTLIPLGERVLIRPAQPPKESESGLIVFPDEKYPEPEQSGEILALGSGRLCPVSHTQVARLREALEMLTATAFESMVAFAESVGMEGGKRPIIHPLAKGLDQAKTALAETEIVHTLPHEVEVGDRVIFSPDSGQELTVNDERLIIMKEQDILAVIEPDKDEDRV